MLATPPATPADAITNSHHEMIALARPLRHALLGATSVRVGPPQVAALLITCGVLCALGLLLAAVTITQWRSTLRWPWDRLRGLIQRRGVPALVKPGPPVLRAARAEETALVPATPAQPVAYPPSESGWQPLAQEILGVGRIEWDARTLRAFAGQPEVLHRLAFCRWRYQQGDLSEFGHEHTDT